MEWFTNNYWWMLVILLSLVVALSVALFILNRKDKRIKKDFQEKVLIVDSEQPVAKAEEKPEQAKEETVEKASIVLESKASKPKAKAVVTKPAAKKVAKESTLTKSVEKKTESLFSIHVRISR